MSERAISVQHCGECPAHHTWSTARGLRERCGIAARSIEMDDPERPKWCPLHDGPVTIRLREEGGDV